jgi:hypothetical protein
MSPGTVYESDLPLAMVVDGQELSRWQRWLLRCTPPTRTGPGPCAAIPGQIQQRIGRHPGQNLLPLRRQCGHAVRCCTEPGTRNRHAVGAALREGAAGHHGFDSAGEAGVAYGNEYAVAYAKRLQLRVVQYVSRTIERLKKAK